MNMAMKRKVEDGDAIDVSKCEREGRYYVLIEFVDGADYCDTEKTVWIWSIGRRISDGKILASTAQDLYQNPDFECMWLR